MYVEIIKGMTSIKKTGKIVHGRLKPTLQSLNTIHSSALPPYGDTKQGQSVSHW